MKKYLDEKEILEIVRKFEDAVIAREDWRHAEHLTVALYYLSRFDFETSYERMRSGIFNLLRAFGVDFSREMPFHETLTVFWLKTVDDFLKSKGGVSTVEICNEMIETFDKDYPLKFYSREQLFSDAARSRYLAPHV